MHKLLASLALLSLTTCGTNGTSSGCEWGRVIHTSDQDILTDSTARQIDAANKTYLKVCKRRLLTR